MIPQSSINVGIEFWILGINFKNCTILSLGVISKFCKRSSWYELGIGIGSSIKLGIKIILILAPLIKISLVHMFLHILYHFSIGLTS